MVILFEVLFITLFVIRIYTLLQLTGALSHVLPIMIVVMTAKWVADSFSTDGIYAVWVVMRGYTWLPPTEFRDSGRTCEPHMMPSDRLAIIDTRVSTLESLSKPPHPFCILSYTKFLQKAWSAGRKSTAIQ